MAKSDGGTKLPPPIEYPKSLLVAYIDHGTEGQFLAAGTEPNQLECEGRATKVARYVLVGTGVIQNSAAQYVEHTAA